MTAQIKEENRQCSTRLVTVLHQIVGPFLKGWAVPQLARNNSHKQSEERSRYNYEEVFNVSGPTQEDSELLAYGSEGIFFRSVDPQSRQLSSILPCICTYEGSSLVPRKTLHITYITYIRVWKSHSVARDSVGYSMSFVRREVFPEFCEDTPCPR